ncbi:cytochrome c [Rhodobacter sp. Har01]|uniref:c-type cytochrome n=1 Tax=Rhodobacter sp. Har01 TaxID=2883999 RepID=UPI001D093234|nr:cytochrome c [Rhodobacter sp. Har01]MCB6180146.1 cytochrome c [Rhodobacter sp. Har01]
MRHRILAGLGLVLLCPLSVGAQDLVPLHHDLAARTFAAACASCHYRGADKTPFGTRGPLADGNPDEVTQSILFGAAPEDDEGGMPAFGPVLTDADVTRLVIWLRSTSKPDDPWPDVEASVVQMRATGSRED